MDSWTHMECQPLARHATTSIWNQGTSPCLNRAVELETAGGSLLGFECFVEAQISITELIPEHPITIVINQGYSTLRFIKHSTEQHYGICYMQKAPLSDSWRIAMTCIHEHEE